MRVPSRIKIAASRIDLNEAHASLDQTPRHQRLLAEIRRHLFAEPVELASRFGLLIDVDRADGVRLHAIGQLIGSDAGGQLGVLRVAFEVLPIQVSQQVEPTSLPLGRHAFGRFQVDDRVPHRAKLRPLVRRRHVAVAPVRSTADRTAAIVGEDDKARQIFVFAAEPVGHPTADAGVSGEHGARIHLVERRAVIGADGMHRADYGEVVDLSRDVGKQIGNFNP